MRILGIDPGLRHTGWGLIEKQGTRFLFLAAGVINPDVDKDLSKRLSELHSSLKEIINLWKPDSVAIEETFVNKNPSSTLKLGQARGVILMTPAELNISVFEYTPNQIKKSITGVGHAEKTQVDMMVHRLISNVPEKLPPDASDALSMALCHAFHHNI